MLAEDDNEVRARLIDARAGLSWESNRDAAIHKFGYQAPSNDGHAWLQTSTLARFQSIIICSAGEVHDAADAAVAEVSAAAT